MTNAASPVRSAARPAAVLAIVLTSYLMILLDISIVITGLPSIREDLGFSPITLSWVQNAYLLCFGAFLLLAARAGDVFGRRCMFIVGLVLFTAASLVIGVAQTPVEMIAARAAQGTGAAILGPSVLALISINFPEGPERTRALAYYSMVAGVGASAGLVLGGVFADLLSWRVGFLMNVPIGIGLILISLRVLTETPRASVRFDVAGAISSTLGMGALVFGIVHAAEEGWSAPVTVASIAAAIILLVAFILIERRVREPILPLGLFASRERSGAYAARMLFLGAMVGFFFFTTQFLQGVLGYTPLIAGAAFLPMTVPTFIAATLVPAFTRRLGNGGLLCSALGLTAAGMVWLSFAGAEASYWTAIALPMLLIGFGNGFALGPLTVAGVARVPAAQAGAASGLVNVAHQLGGSLGLGLLIVVFAAASREGVADHHMLAHQISASILTGSIMLLLSFIISAIFVAPRSRA